MRWSSIFRCVNKVVKLIQIFLFPINLWHIRAINTTKIATTARVFCLFNSISHVYPCRDPGVWYTSRSPEFNHPFHIIIITFPLDVHLSGRMLLPLISTALFRLSSATCWTLHLNRVFDFCAGQFVWIKFYILWTFYLDVSFRFPTRFYNEFNNFDFLPKF